MYLNSPSIEPSRANINAFTLAEVLITLGIIGIVAALTMPSLIAKNTEKQTITRVQKFRAMTEQAYLRAKLDNGNPDLWGFTGFRNPSGADNLYNIFKPYLKIIKYCGHDVNKCWGANTPDYSTTAVLADGSYILFYSGSTDCNVSRGSSKALNNYCGNIEFDINGKKGPNQYGLDIFVLYITKYGLIPAGTKEEVETWNPFGRTCLTTIGAGCSAWIMYNQNMEYKYCKDLSWDGKTTCSK